METRRRSSVRRYLVTSVLIGVPLVGVISAVIAVSTSRAKPAEPELELDAVATDTVRRGEMVRQVRGLGTLVPEELVHIPAPYAGRVERINRLSGSAVSADTEIVELSNLDLERQALDAAWNLQTAESDLASLKAQVQSQRVSQRSDLAALQAQHRDAKAKNDRDKVLYREGLMLELDYRLSTNAVENLVARIGFEQERAKALGEALDAQLASKETLVKQLRAVLQSRRDQVNALKVRAGIPGTIQQVVVQVGQQVAAGADLATIVQPQRLKVSLAIAETQAKDVVVGQNVGINTQNGTATGHIVRIDPSVVNGTRAVDVRLDGALPPDAAPDKSVDGTIEIERLANVVYTGRPVGAQAGSEISIFKISPDGREATRVQVKLGRVSLNTVQVLDGVKPGDRVILSDTSAVDGHYRIRLK